jgi:methanogenic corrinoid protein MtbC1
MPETVFDPQCLRLIASLRQAEDARAADLVRRCTGRLGAEATYLRVLIPAVFGIGELFTSGQIDAATCDRCVAGVLRLMDDTRAALARRPPMGRRCFASFMPGYVHSVGFIAICHWLERDGWDVIRPACVPAEAELPGQILACEPDLVALSCSLPRNVVQARRVIRHLRAAGCRAPVWIGGLPINVVPGMFERTGADRTAKDIVSFTRDLAAEFGYQTATPPGLAAP